MATEKSGSGDRIVLIDALRGFALFGILLSHFQHWYVVGPLPDDIIKKDYGAFSAATDTLVRYFVSNKFYVLFSFIFGLSFYLQTVSFKKYGGSLDLYFVRRAFFLFVIGTIHYSLWLGDILAVYALLMLPLLFIRRFNDKWMVITALILIFNVPGIALVTAQSLRTHAEVSQAVGATINPLASGMYEAVAHGGITDCIRYNLHFIHTRVQFQVYSGSLFMILGFFTLGMLTVRKKWLLRVGELKGKFTLIIVACILTVVGLQYWYYSLSDVATGPGIKSLQFLLAAIISVAAVIMNIAIVAALMFNKYTQKFTVLLADLGRMALTNYLIQTCLGMLLFYHFGAGIFGRTTPGQNLLIATGIFVFQLFFSRFWFRYFNYGLVEWLLRAGTLWHFKDLRKTKNTV